MRSSTWFTSRSQIWREITCAWTGRSRTRPSVRLAYLVDEEAVEPFQELVRDLESELGHVQLACTGPWPPYSFAGGGIE